MMINALNQDHDMPPPSITAENCWAGGIPKPWKQQTGLKQHNKGHHVNQTTPHQTGEDMMNQQYELKQHDVYYPQFNPLLQQDPDILNPQTTNTNDIKHHAQFTQELSTEYIRSAERLWHKMETHPIHPIDFNNPSPQSFANYMNACKQYGVQDRKGHLVPATKNALNNRRKAWHICLVAWGVHNIWPTYTIRRIPDRKREIPIPTPETVHALLTYKYTKNRDLNRHIQYHFFFGFLIGLAPEKEFVILNKDDIIIDNNGNYLLRAQRTKTVQSRILRLEKTIAASKVHKSIYNYLTHTRPKYADEGETALFTNPQTHERWTPGALRQYLTRHGKQVYQAYYPYLMRHWCGTARMIEWEHTGSAYERVNYWLGHKKHAQTKTYLEFSRLFDDNKGSWLSRALKHTQCGGLHVSPDFAQQTPEKWLVEQNLSEKQERICRDSNDFLLIFCTTTPGKHACRANHHVHINTLNLLSFLFIILIFSAFQAHQYCSIDQKNRSDKYTMESRGISPENMWWLFCHAGERQQKLHIKSQCQAEQHHPQNRVAVNKEIFSLANYPHVFLFMAIHSMRLAGSNLGLRDVECQREASLNFALHSTSQVCPYQRIFGLAGVVYGLRNAKCQQELPTTTNLHFAFQVCPPYSSWETNFFCILSSSQIERTGLPPTFQNHHGDPLVLTKKATKFFLTMDPPSPLIQDYLTYVAGQKTLFSTSGSLSQEFLASSRNNIFVANNFKKALSSHYSPKNIKTTYNTVCQNINILEYSRNSENECNVTSMYVMLCYVIVIHFITYLILSLFLLYKSYDIPYSMLCYL